MSAHVAVLMGGLSVERDVSLVSGVACAEALGRRGYGTSKIDVGRDLAEQLAALEPDVCFNALHGRFGEDGCVQGVLETLAIPYTHSGVRASAVAMHKPTAKTLFEAAGVRCPQGVIADWATIGRGEAMSVPFVAKPIAEGSSVGVYIVLDEGDPVLRRNPEPDEGPFLVEPFVQGLELSVAVLDGEPLTVTEIKPSEGFYDYRAKYTEGAAEHILPAALPEPVFEAALVNAAIAHETLGCRGLSRADFRYDPTPADADGLFLLEINTQPGMTPLSLAPEQAHYRGIEFDELVVRLVEDASCAR
ncbi:MAG: D-alanine--D-alanine ligase [Geminicoccaceae bacterium]